MLTTCRAAGQPARHARAAAAAAARRGAAWRPWRRRARATFNHLRDAQRLPVLGINNNPRTPHVRGWIRGTHLQRLPPRAEALLRFGSPGGAGWRRST